MRYLFLIILFGLSACGSDVPVAPDPDLGPSAAIDIILAQREFEPGEGAQALVRVLDAQGFWRPPTAPVEWISSEPQIATVAVGFVTGLQPGETTITARVNGSSASTSVRIVWRDDARLVISTPTHIGINARFPARALVRNTHPVQPSGWTSSDTRVATVDASGMIETRSLGQVEISAHYLGLTGLATLEVKAPGEGFGYFYSDQVQYTDYMDYDLWDFIPAPDRGYSTASTIRATFATPYQTSVDFGWVGPAMKAPDVMLQAVPLEPVPCAAFLNSRTDLSWIPLGAPSTSCEDRMGVFFSRRMELVAASTNAFTGTTALIRPGMPPFVSNGAVLQVVSTGLTHDYQVSGLTRDSLYWFLTPAVNGITSCSVAPAHVTPSSATARISCREGNQSVVTPALYAIGFGSDAARGTNPRGFAEFDGTGQTVRAMNSDLTITAVPAAPRAFDVSITGERVAEFDRLPAVLLTPVSQNAPFCWMPAFARTGRRSVVLRIQCDSAVDGLLIGALY